MTDPDRPIKPIRRRRWALVMLTITAIAVFATWRLTSLDGLPDVGDPFDVAEFADASVPDDRNAFTLYRQASKLLTRMPREATHDWATAGPAERKWLESNREAMETWRRGTERPDALFNPPRLVKYDTLLEEVQQLRQFARAATLEGSRLEAVGDMDGALTWYIAILRSGRHAGTRGCDVERIIGTALNGMATRQLIRWAADPRVDARMLRRAIDAALAAREMTRPTSETLKVEYLMYMNTLEEPKLMDREVIHLATRKDRWGPIDTPTSNAMHVAIPRVLKREPERSRRVIRLIFANQLAYCDRPTADQPPRVATIPPGYSPTAAFAPLRPGVVANLIVDLYAVDPSAPAAARAMPPAEIAIWWDSTLYARACLMEFNGLISAIARERIDQAALLATLRAELEKRDHPEPKGTTGDRR